MTEIESGAITFNVTVDVEDEWGQWRVRIFFPDGGQYAQVQTASLDTALRMALPYMASVTQPDPFASLLR
jgi:hypothetical protein